MPANAERQVADPHYLPAGVIFNRVSRQNARPLAKTAVRFLQGDDVCVYFAQYSQNALRIALPVKANAFVDVIAGNCQFHRSGHYSITG